MTTLGKTLKRLRILRKELAGIGFELTIGKSDDAALAVRLGERLRELKPYSDILDKMFTGLSDRLPNGERADTGWVPPTSTAVMDDGLRERMRRAIGARTWQEFLDTVYKLGLFRGN